MRWFVKKVNPPLQGSPLSTIERLKQELANCRDVSFREIALSSTPPIQVAVIYTEGLVDKPTINDFVSRSLITDFEAGFFGDQDYLNRAFQYLKSHMQSLGNVRTVCEWDEMVQTALSGDILLLIEGWDVALAGAARGGESRQIAESSTEVVIRGPKEGFTESLSTNLSMIRRRIKSPNLYIEPLILGRVTQTDIAIIYLNGIANDKIVNEVKQRLNRIDIDGILESGYIEELIEDETFTAFPTVYNTERPDVLTGNLLGGRIGIMVDGTPFALIVPTVLAQFFQSPEDYYQRFDIANALRMLRYFAFIVSLVGPSIYIAVITFHQEMIPTTLLISIAAQREGVPFPAFIEAVMMEASFEMIREAGVRMPRAVGQAVSIVGALILGQAAVQAGIVSAAMVIVVAATGIASYSMPKYNFANSARIIRFLFMSLSASFGFFGLTLGLIMLTAHMASLRSFGIPYLSPYAPFIPTDQKDTLFRFPLWAMVKRSRLINQTNRIRMKDNLKPSPSKGNNRSQGDADGSK